MADQFAKSLRESMTDAERRMWFLLRDRRLKGYKFRRQVPLGLYIVDFVCLSARLIVELNGGQHAEQAISDKARDDWLSSQGFIVMRFWNNDVLANTEEVLLNILKHCETLSPHPCPSPARGEGKLRRHPKREGNIRQAHRMGEEGGTPHEELLRRLRWRCRRGLLELDVWLERFAVIRLQELTGPECMLLESLLQEADADLLAWLQGQQPVPKDYEEMVAGIRMTV